MTAHLIDGRAIAERLRDQITSYVETLNERTGIKPGLAVVLVGDDPASHVYVRNKAAQTIAAGMVSFEHRLPVDTTESELLSLIASLNADASVHGILIQLPLPPHLNADLVINAIAPSKDVDGFHVSNVGMLGIGRTSMVPCTPLGCLLMLQQHARPLSGKHAVVVGRSNIVGKPMAQLLLSENCTVTIAHSRSQDLRGICRQADILVVAVGRPEIITADFVRDGAIVIDVGINRIERDGRNRLVGDVHFDSVSQVAGAITPVPGGVGPMTIACLLANTVVACCRANELEVPIGLTS